MRKWKQLGFNVIKDSFDQLPTAVCFFDPLGRIVLCNRQMYRLSQHLFQRDMQYLGEVEAALASPPDGVKKLSDMEHTYRSPDRCGVLAARGNRNPSGVRRRCARFFFYVSVLLFLSESEWG